jgi:predicted HTH domain antitoxin
MLVSNASSLIKVATEQVKKNRLTISETADLLGVGVGNMMDLLVRNGYKLELGKELLIKALKLP